MERTDTSRGDDNSLTTAVADGFQAAVYTGVQQPYDSIRQIASNTVHLNLPEARLFSAPAEAKAGSIACFAEAIGSGAGMVPWLVATHKMVSAGTSFAGLSSETAAMARGISVRDAGLTGATYSALFQPVQNNGNFFLNKATDAGIAFGTFAAGTDVNNTLRPLFGSFTSELANRALSAGTASLSGFGAGVINQELSNLSGKQHQDPFSTGLKFALVGGVFGAAAKINSDGESVKSSTKFDDGQTPRASSGSSDFLADRTQKGERTTVSNMFERNPTEASRNHDMFGPRPDEVERSITEIKTRFGENSNEHASGLIQLGDAHMMQGRLSNPQAQASYEQALQIFRSQGEQSPQTAWTYDKLAGVKESSGDRIGAAADLSKALEIWKTMDPETSNATENHIARRTEDLAKLQRVIQFQARRLPEIKPET